MPARKVTACTFGGEHLDQLFITTSQENIDTSEDRLAGSLFCADIGLKGLPVRLFAGLGRRTVSPAEASARRSDGGIRRPRAPQQLPRRC